MRISSNKQEGKDYQLRVSKEECNNALSEGESAVRQCKTRSIMNICT